jgi:hypothetical protein
MSAESVLARLRAPGAWLWIVLVVGALLRIYLVVATEGSFDVRIKTHHGRMLQELGLHDYYRGHPVFNHPPLAGRFFEGAYRLAEATGIPFRVLLRAPFALLDAATAAILFALFRASPWRYAVVAGYWLHPLAWIFSSFHGNTDSFVAFSALLALLATARGRPGLAGAALGLGLAVKLPTALAVPALFFATPGLRARARLVGAAAAVALVSYLPIVVTNPRLLYRRFFGYAGSDAVTIHDVPIWGIWRALQFERAPGLGDAAAFFTEHNTLVCLLPILLVAWLRRDRRETHEIGATIFASFMLLYGFTAKWAFQYLAWSTPFWFYCAPVFAWLGSLVLSSYIYGVYAYYCGNPWLLGEWQHQSRVLWPIWLLLIRNAAVAFCLGMAILVLIEAVRGALRKRR